MLASLDTTCSGGAWGAGGMGCFAVVVVVVVLAGGGGGAWWGGGGGGGVCQLFFPKVSSFVQKGGTLPVDFFVPK